jgi:mRNA interferase RelE/StbE
LVYRIQVVRTAQKQILSLPKEVQIQVVRAIDNLVNTPRPSGCKKLHGTDLWRIRIVHYRVIYHIVDEALLVILVKVALRKEDTYRGL